MWTWCPLQDEYYVLFIYYEWHVNIDVYGCNRMLILQELKKMIMTLFMFIKPNASTELMRYEFLID